MPEFRAPHEKSKYYVPWQTLQLVRTYCRMYPTWKREYDESAGLRNVTQGNGSGGIGDPTASQAMRRKELSDRIDLIERTAVVAEGTIHNYLLLGVTQRHMTFDRLKALGMPCERDMYYDRRRKFYWLMAQRLHL